MKCKIILHPESGSATHDNDEFDLSLLVKLLLGVQ